MEAARQQMVEYALRQAGIRHEGVLASMLATRRHEFVPEEMLDFAYHDAGLPIGEGQTISSPFIVAYMTEALDPQPSDRVLEIGTGSGYQAAVLSPLVQDVYTIEIVEPLGLRAAQALDALDYDNVHARIGDGYLGWEEHAPFDKIIVTCSPESVPQPLVEQLKEGGMIVIPVGERHQQALCRMVKRDGALIETALRPTLFVPMMGAAEEQRAVFPDGRNPALQNGDFEEGLDDTGSLRGWYYQRQLELVESTSAPGGTRFIRFSNDRPGQHAHVMQGFAIDGRKVQRVEFRASVASVDAARGSAEENVPAAGLTFYDEDRRPIHTALLGPILGTQEWRELISPAVRVPKTAREAVVRVGLFGGTGRVSFDRVSITRVPAARRR